MVQAPAPDVLTTVPGSTATRVQVFCAFFESVKPKIQTRSPKILYLHNPKRCILEQRCRPNPKDILQRRRSTLDPSPSPILNPINLENPINPLRPNHWNDDKGNGLGSQPAPMAEVGSSSFGDAVAKP